MSMLGLGGLAARRPDQQYRPGGQGVTPGSRGIGKFRLVIVYGTGQTGIFDYQGTPKAGNPPVASLTPPGTTHDPYGNTVRDEFATRDPATGAYIHISGNSIVVGNGDADTGFTIQGGGGTYTVDGGITGIAGDVRGTLGINSKALSVSGNQPQGGIMAGAFAPVTGAMWEVQGGAQGSYAAAMAAAGAAYAALRAADTQNRWQVDRDGAHQWSNGTAAFDTTLYRDAAGLLGVTAVAADAGGGATFTRQSMNTRGYQNSWADVGGTFEPGFYEFQAQNNKVHLSGVLTRTGTPAATEVVINLPTAYHPAHDHNFPVANPGAAAAANMFFQYLQNGNLVARNMNTLSNPSGIGFDVLIDIAA